MKRSLALPVATVLMLTCAVFGVAIDASQDRVRGGSPAVVDLGMMDGSFTIPTAINDRGAIVGNAFSSVSGHSVTFLWTRARGFQKILGELEAQPFDINDRGEVVGVIVTGELSTTGFLWSPTDGVTELGPFTPAAINNRSQIAGSCVVSTPSGQTSQACLWQDGVVTAIGPSDSTGAGINNRGHVVGQQNVGDTFKAFLWTVRNGLSTLPGPGTTSAAAINQHDRIVGNTCCIDEAVDQRGIIWPNQDRFRLVPVGEILVDVNDRNEIVGRRGNPWQGFVITKGRDTVALEDGVPVGINNRSQIAGYRATADGTHLIVWSLQERGRHDW